jgi:hypothetical protein
MITKRQLVLCAFTNARYTHLLSNPILKDEIEGISMAHLPGYPYRLTPLLKYPYVKHSPDFPETREFLLKAHGTDKDLYYYISAMSQSKRYNVTTAMMTFSCITLKAEFVSEVTEKPDQYLRYLHFKCVKELYPLVSHMKHDPLFIDIMKQITLRQDRKNARMLILHYESEKPGKESHFCFSGTELEDWEERVVSIYNEIISILNQSTDH